MGLDLIFYTFKYRLFTAKSRKISLRFGANLNNKVVLKGANTIGRMTRLRNCTIGYATYVGENSSITDAIIGKYCSIGDRVIFIGGNHPTTKFVSTHPAFYSTRGQAGVAYVSNDIFKEYTFIENKTAYIIGNDVWIGSDVRIMPGVTVGDGAIIGTGALITQDVLPYEIVAGVPAKHIRFRFSEEQIKKLLLIQWWDFPEKTIKSIASSMSDIKEFLNCSYILEEVTRHEEQ